MVAMDFFAALNSYDFFNQYCSNLLKNPTVRGLREEPILLGSISERLEHCCFFQFMRSPNLGGTHTETV